MEKRNKQIPVLQESDVHTKPDIISIRGLRVIIDAELADVYGVKTKRLKE